MLRKIAFSALAVVAVGCGGSGGDGGNRPPLNLTDPDFLILNDDGTLLRSGPTGVGQTTLNQVKAGYGAVSPDGDLVVFTTVGQANVELRAVGSDGTNEHKVIDLTHESSVSFLANGAEVAYVEGDAAGAKLKAVNVTTGVTRDLADLPAGSYTGSGISLDPASALAAVTVEVPTDEQTHVVMLNLSNGQQIDLGRGRNPRFSQNGAYLGYITPEENLKIRNLASQTTTTTDLGEPIQEVAFAENGSEVFISLLVQEDAETARNKVARMVIGSQNPQLLTGQADKAYSIVAAVGPG